MLITGTSRGIGNALVKKFIKDEYIVIGCSRNETDFNSNNYKHYALDIIDESEVLIMFQDIRKRYRPHSCLM